MILADNGDPDHVTKSLSLSPSSSWTKDHKHKWAGWKKYLPKTLERKPLEEQLSYWVRKLIKKRRSVSALIAKGYYCAMDIYISTDATASIILCNDLMNQTTQLGLDLRISIFSDNKKQTKRTIISSVRRKRRRWNSTLCVSFSKGARESRVMLFLIGLVRWESAPSADVRLDKIGNRPKWRKYA